MGPDAVIFEQPEVKKATSAKRQLTLNWGKGYLTKADTPLTKKQKVGVSSKVGESSKGKEKHVCLECLERCLEGKQEKGYISICRLGHSSVKRHKSRWHERPEAMSCTFVPASSPAVASLKRKHAVIKEQRNIKKNVEFHQDEADVPSNINIESHAALGPEKVKSTHQDTITPTEVMEGKVETPANVPDEHSDSSTSIHASSSSNIAVNQATLLNFFQTETTSSPEQPTRFRCYIWIKFES